MEKKEIREMTIDELEARKNAIASEVEQEGADLDALEEEVRAIKEELEKKQRRLRSARQSLRRRLLSLWLK